ncbi:hypothetical protein BC826DRAFT_1109745 [Russula brevipes]|nr:hypothetical protein BC826DRAFT_1109745 [Russula brevipes]
MDPPSPRLSSLTALAHNSKLPAVVAGDFNTHSPLWSTRPLLGERATVSAWAHRVEDWMDAQGLSLLSPPEVPTRRGEHGQRDTVIDLVLSILTTSPSPTRLVPTTPPSPSRGPLPSSSLRLPPPAAPTPRWIVQDSLQDLWQEHFCTLAAAPAFTTDDPTALAHALLQSITEANDFAFERAHPLSLGRGARWWNDACSGTLAQLKAAPPDERQAAFRRLRATIRVAKRDWAESVLTDATNDVDHHALWAAAKRRKGRSNPLIPPICTVSRDTSTTHEDMTAAFRARFFPTDALPVATAQPEDPAPRPTRPHAPLTEDEVHHCLADTSNSSAPVKTGTEPDCVHLRKYATPEKQPTGAPKQSHEEGNAPEDNPDHPGGDPNDEDDFYHDAFPTINAGTPDGKILGNLPSPFTGDRTRAEEFLTNMQAYFRLNIKNAQMHSPMTRVALCLSTMEGPDIEEWKRDVGKWFDRLNPNIDDRMGVWHTFEKEFKKQFKDSQSEPRARMELQHLEMKWPLVDKYVSNFEKLARLAGYDHTNPETTHFFMNGLPKSILTDVLHQENGKMLNAS